ncbi:similar to Saccharomyces cerevisiae YGR189C CRH1 Chitin transglycosylase that functions in the transfer of chitin to beta(1-6) and beta(1-3) glucans in the cell wall [Maudiozyma saulgeensis]|uniref:Crh-like protein n=1 Tax=Maudiozyma saulgeensis TaxID=1789683 RepID=A0A1X7R5M7_9SACH|nr:similar to Saccharomyces cerevisiae YGR189C CRH1 Chitin transglycosylase that functions in the transfer of chitin to beta(1-6) and beta(1-3) glucans in the cell wall [Kazachstania saulgeensis]
MSVRKNLLLLAAGTSVVAATTCNPLTSTSCSADTALAGSFAEDFTSASSYFTDEKMPGTIEYSSDGLAMTLTEQGDNPTLTSNFYIMYGKVEVMMKAAPGTGIVSSFFLQSDDLDELDIEWVGSDDTQFQSNYFSKGDTTTYDRGEFHTVSEPETTFHNYTLEWAMDKTTWYLDGTAVRVLENTTSEGYPQSPMYLKMGIWAGGDPSNSEGTIEWAGGLTDYSQAPFTMYISKVIVTDYSTGSEYSYGDQSGSWESIQCKDGEINGRYQQALMDFAELTNGGTVSNSTTTSTTSSSSAVASSSSTSEIVSSEVTSSSTKATTSSTKATTTSTKATTTSTEATTTSTKAATTSTKAATTSSSSKVSTVSPTTVENSSSLEATKSTASVSQTSSSQAVKVASDMANGITASFGLAALPLLLLSLL